MLQFKILLLYYSLCIAAGRIRKEAGFQNLLNGWKETELVSKKKKFPHNSRKCLIVSSHTLPESGAEIQKWQK